MPGHASWPVWRPDGRPSGLDAHLDQWGPVDWRRTRLSLIGEVDASGLAGHGGAWFPVGAKWRAIARQRGRRPIVVANGAEGEPASGKDALLLTRAPHLVLDGLASASVALRAAGAVVYVPEHLTGPVEAAIAMRRRRHLDPVTMMVARAPDTYLAGQEAAVVRSLNGGPALPYFVGLRSVRRARGRRATDAGPERRDLRPRRPRRPLRRPVVQGVGHGRAARDDAALGQRPLGSARRRRGATRGAVRRRPRSGVVRRRPVPRRPAGRLRRWMGAAGGAARPRAWTSGRSARPARRSAPGSSPCCRRRRAPWPRWPGSSATWPAREPGSAVRAERVCRRWLMSSSGARSGPAHRGPASARSSTCVISSRVVAPAGTLTASLGSPAVRARSSPTRSPSTSATGHAARPGAAAGSPSPVSPGHRASENRDDRIAHRARRRSRRLRWPRGMRRALPRAHLDRPVGLSPCQPRVDPTRPD